MNLKRCPLIVSFTNYFQDKKVPQPVMDVIEEEINKLRSLDSHASEFK